MSQLTNSDFLLIVWIEAKKKGQASSGGGSKSYDTMKEKMGAMV